MDSLQFHKSEFGERSCEACKAELPGEYFRLNASHTICAGRAVKQGAHGRGARRLQVAAVALTYLSITFSYIPVGIQQLSAAAAISVWGTPGAIVMLSGLAVISPFLNLTEGIGGVLGLFIIFLGLQRAWAGTGRHPRQVTGPFEREAAIG